MANKASTLYRFEVTYHIWPWATMVLSIFDDNITFDKLVEAILVKDIIRVFMQKTPFSDLLSPLN